MSNMKPPRKSDEPLHQPISIEDLPEDGRYRTVVIHTKDVTEGPFISPLDLEAYMEQVRKMATEETHLYVFAGKQEVPAAFGALTCLGCRFRGMTVWPTPDHELQTITSEPEKESARKFLDGRVQIFGTMDGSRGEIASPLVAISERRDWYGFMEEAYHIIEQISPGPRIELFGNHGDSGWDHWRPEPLHEKK